MLTIETGEDEYRIVDGATEGDTFPYGETAILESNGVLYVASLDADDTPSSGFEMAVYELSKRVSSTSAVDFTEDDNEDSEPEGEEYEEDEDLETEDIEETKEA